MILSCSGVGESEETVGGTRDKDVGNEQRDDPTH